MVRLRPGAAFGGTDVVDVEYRDPIDGSGYRRRVAVEQTSPLEEDRLRAMAKRHEKLAEELRSRER